MNHGRRLWFHRAILLAGLIFLFFPLWGDTFAQTEKEPNDEAGQANLLPLNTEIKGFANTDGDEDWYALTIPAPGLDILVIEVSGIAEIDLSLRLYEAGRTDEYIIKMDGNKEGKGEKIVRMRQRPGKFLIRVDAAGTNQSEPYTLRAGKPTKPPASEAEVAQALRKALDYLASEQTKEGYFGDDHVGKSGLVVMALLGGKCTGKDYSKSIQAGLRYLQSQFDEGTLYEGGPKASWTGATDGMYSHAIATLAAIEAIAELKDAKLKPMAEQALQ
ncbi:MAG: hypothetical protein FJY81_04200, partial [Candidatus Aminicenantes bacterium]|nr:hypothetical protein [Candidatus Aminicenantes bacterium]